MLELNQGPPDTSTRNKQSLVFSANESKELYPGWPCLGLLQVYNNHTQARGAVQQSWRRNQGRNRTKCLAWKLSSILPLWQLYWQSKQIWPLRRLTLDPMFWFIGGPKELTDLNILEKRELFPTSFISLLKLIFWVTLVNKLCIFQVYNSIILKVTNEQDKKRNKNS